MCTNHWNNIDWVQLGSVVEIIIYIQSVKAISAIIVTDDYLCYKEPKNSDNLFSYFSWLRW